MITQTVIDRFEIENIREDIICIKCKKVMNLLRSSTIKINELCYTFYQYKCICGFETSDDKQYPLYILRKVE